MLNTKCVFLFHLQLLSKTFLILRNVQRDIIINLLTYSYKVHVIPVRFLMKLEFPRPNFGKSSNVKFYENPSSDSRAVPYDGWTDR